jgi:hypothetical protein
MIKPIRTFTSFIAILIFFFTLTACSGQAPSGTQGNVITGNKQPIVTTAPNSGLVNGTILVNQNGKLVPVKNYVLYLGNIIISPDGKAGVAGLDVSRAPYATTDNNGSFAFYNVPAGKYGLILYLVTHSFLLNETGREASLIITVTSGKTTDLGEMKYTTFPITP